MEIRNLDMHPIRKVVGREILPGNGIRGDQGNVILTLECGHTLTKKHSQTKHKQTMRCVACGFKTSRQDQEHGPHRFRQGPQHQQSLPQRGFRLDPFRLD